MTELPSSTTDGEAAIPNGGRARRAGNQDVDVTPPAARSEFRTRVAVADAVRFVTPEYNRSVPAALKNALDIGSPPPGRNVWSGKPGAVVTATTGQLGGFGANHHLCQSLTILNVPTMQ
jgi:chromate reductase